MQLFVGDVILESWRQIIRSLLRRMLKRISFSIVQCKYVFIVSFNHVKYGCWALNMHFSLWGLVQLFFVRQTKKKTCCHSGCSHILLHSNAACHAHFYTFKLLRHQSQACVSYLERCSCLAQELYSLLWCLSLKNKATPEPRVFTPPSWFSHITTHIVLH